jgi:transcriptional regulator with XRE-family HTH domain
MNPSLEMRLPVSIEKVRADRSLLKAARVKLGLEQEQLARAAGVTTNTISNFETGKAVAHESTRGAIQQALEARGIVFTNGGKPGFYFDKDKVIIPT